jgi:FkbM family methyltransferase
MTIINMTYGQVDTDVIAENVRNSAMVFTREQEWEIRSVGWEHLTHDSVVVEIGGYTGTWAYRMAKRFNPNLFIFEPQEWCCAVLKKLLEGYDTHIYPFALGAKKGSFPVCNYETDGCSFEKINAGVEREYNHTLPMKKMSTEFEIIGLAHIDLMHMNIEGSELTLIPHMLKNNIIPDIFLLQYHDETHRPILFSQLEKHYIQLFNYGTILSAWKRKEANV